jgi:phospholipid N-methyltransferase
MTESLKFLAAFLRNPTSIGSVAPSSRWLAERMTQQMALGEADVVVELGPGTGAFTESILRGLGPKGRYFAIELNEEFASRLAMKHPGLDVVVGSAEKLAFHLDVIGEEQADSIICSLPWTNFPRRLQEEIMDSVVQSLPEGGRFATFAYVHAAWFPAARRFRRFLETRFQRVETTSVVWRNLPPAVVYRCSK